MKAIALVKIKASRSYVDEKTLADALKEHTKVTDSRLFELADRRLTLQTTFKLVFDTFAELNLNLEKELKLELNNIIWVDTWTVFWELEKIYGSFDDE